MKNDNATQEAPPPGRPLTLWYRQPAAIWDEALPIGNGRLGGMVFGGVDRERIQINEDTLWSRPPLDMHNPDALDALPEVRRLIFEGKIHEAELLAYDALMSVPKRIKPYQPVGDLWIAFDEGAESAGGYRRELDMEEGIARVTYHDGETRFYREAFVSAVDDALVVHLWCAEPGMISFRTGLAAIEPQPLDPERRANYEAYAQKVIADSDSDPLTVKQVQSALKTFTQTPPAHVTTTASFPPDRVVLRGRADNGEGVRFAAMLRAMPEGGSISADGGELVVRGADTVTLVLVAATSYAGGDIDGQDPVARCDAWLKSAGQKRYEELRAAHIADHGRLFNRVAIDLGDTPESIADLPTDARIARIGEDAENAKDDPNLIEQQFQFGRYLLMASSRPGTQAANLQGIWNGSMSPPWYSAYTTNINIEMNYWPAEVTNLAECAGPLFDLVEELRPTGRETARRHYGCGGFVAHHNTNLWRLSVPINALEGLWPTGAAWMALHMGYHDDFAPDGDEREAFLRDRAYPVLKEVAEFFLDFLVEDPEGRLVCGPSVSPESWYIAEDGKRACLCMGPSMDQQIIDRVFARCMDYGERLGVDADFRARLSETREKMLPPLRIGSDGRLMEWPHEYADAEPGHRHVSHLFSLFPSAMVTPRSTPEFAEAVRAAMETRLENGSGQTGWSAIWFIHLWARLGEGERAYNHIPIQLGNYVRLNLFGNAHGHTQLDCTYGITSAIAEMLLQSHEDAIALLPALPAAWQDGSFEGLRARGGHTVDLVWRGGKVQEAAIRAGRTGTLRIRTEAPLSEVQSEGRTIPFMSEDGAVGFSAESGKVYKLLF